MTLEQAEETIRSIIPYRYNVPAEDIEEAKETIFKAIKDGYHVANYFGMTVEAERRVMRNALHLIRIIVDDYVFGCDSGSEDWREYFTGWSEELDEEVKKSDYPSDFCYHIPSDEWLFKNLISLGTYRGGMGSAIEECQKIGDIVKENES